MKPRKGFTLIELLVVIAIIAILAAILFPVFAKAREKARQSSCTSNLKQLSLGILQYAQDFDERYPPRIGNMFNGWSEDWSWKRVIEPYLKSLDVQKCPSNPTNIWNCYDNRTPRSYACNGHDQYNVPMPSNNGKPLAVVKAPASLILLTEIREGWTEMNLDGCWSWFNHNDAMVPTAFFAAHMGMANFAFADGHVKSMKPNQTVNAAMPLNMWDCDGPNTPPFGNSVNELNAITDFYNR